MPILDPVPGDVPSTPTNAPPSAEQGAEQPTSPGIRTATAYAERYEAPYRLSDQMEGLAGLMLFGGLSVGVAAAASAIRCPGSGSARPRR